VGWAIHIMGLDNPVGHWELFWSGFGSCLAELALPFTFVGWYWHHTCHVDRCWRPGHYKISAGGVEYKLCRRHHPRVPIAITADHVGRGVV
jgi:hypothetical protein